MKYKKNNNNLAPICLFVYNRLDHTRKTVEALQKNILADQSDLIIFSDAPKNDSAKENVENVRNYIKTINGFNSITITERKENWGLAKSIINGVSDVVNKYGKIIVLEDDLITSKYFLKYMNDALDVYKEDEKVMHINGYLPPINYTPKEIFFYRHPSSWGWATWERSWKFFNGDTRQLLNKIKQKKNGEFGFNIDDSYNFSSTLKANIRRDINTWAVKWYASVFLNNGLCLNPNISLVKNIGFDGSGINCEKNDVYNVVESNKEINVYKIKLKEEKEILFSMKKFYYSIRPKLINKIITRTKLFLKKYIN